MDSYGLLGILPPVIVIVLAFVTKDVIISLFLGILSATLIISGGNIGMALIKLTDALASSLNDAWNIRILLFCSLLGGLVGMLQKTGAAASFGKWASYKLKSKKGSQLMTFIFGLFIFIDDYFNSLTVGTVMRPITDKSKTSRAKLAFILDSTAAPVCILVPLSSWVVTVMSIVREADGFDKLSLTPLEFFIKSIPYNLYAITALLLVLASALTNRDFGPMKESEERAGRGMPCNEERYGKAAVYEEKSENTKAKPVDMFVPITLLILSSLFFFPFVTWYEVVDGVAVKSLFDAVKSIPLSEAYKNSDASKALFYAILFTLSITYVYYLARRLMTIKSAGETLQAGMKQMVSALIILTMAWTIGSLIKNSPTDGGLGLGKYLSSAVVNASLPFAFLPICVFILSSLIAFATGTSWGTFGIMIPIVMPIAVELSISHGFDTEKMINSAFIAVSAAIGGAVFGDHASPISDTTILSSAGAGCPHLEHVATQLPYAFFSASCCAVGFLVSGLTLNIPAAWCATLALFVIGLVFLPKYFPTKTLPNYPPSSDVSSAGSFKC